MPQMQMVIIMENSLSAMALRSILVDITPASVEVVSSLDETRRFLFVFQNHLE